MAGDETCTQLDRADPQPRLLGSPLLRAQPVCTGRGALTCDLGLRGEMLGLLCPGGGMDGHAPVTPRADVVVFGRHLDDVLLASIGIRDGV